MPETRKIMTVLCNGLSLHVSLKQTQATGRRARLSEIVSVMVHSICAPIWTEAGASNTLAGNVDFQMVNWNIDRQSGCFQNQRNVFLSSVPENAG